MNPADVVSVVCPILSCSGATWSLRVSWAVKVSSPPVRPIFQPSKSDEVAKSSNIVLFASTPRRISSRSRSSAAIVTKSIANNEPSQRRIISHATEGELGRTRVPPILGGVNSTAWSTLMHPDSSDHCSIVCIALCRCQCQTSRVKTGFFQSLAEKTFLHSSAQSHVVHKSAAPECRT